MKRSLFLLFLFLSVSISFAQTQQGIVKTRGRVVNGQVVPGTRLTGATITLNIGNPLVSGDDGDFSFNVPTGKNYSLVTANKQGYTLADPEYTRRTFAYSASNPFYVVLEDEAQRQADINAATRKVRRTLTAQLQAREDEIEALKEQNKLTEAEYQKRLQELYDNQSKSEQLVKEMAERYASTDYDQLDEFNRQVQMYIEEGELQKADSMIRSKGDMEQRVAEYHNVVAANQKTRQQLEQSEAGAAKTYEDLAQDLLRRSEIFMQAFQQDSALYCLKMRADLDTTNVEAVYQYSVLCYKQKKYIDCEKYNFICLRFYKNKDDIFNMSMVQNCLGILYKDLHDYANSEKYYKLALENREHLFNQNPDTYRQYLGITQNCLGILYKNLHDYANCEKYYKLALENYEQLSKQNPDNYLNELAMVQNNFGGLCLTLDDYVNSEKYYILALKNHELLFSRNPDNHRESLAMTQNNLAILYKRIQDYTNSEKYYKLAIENLEQLFAQNPDAYRTTLAFMQINLGIFYISLHDYVNSAKYYKLASENFEHLFSQNPEANREGLAMTQYSLGLLYNELQDYTNCEKYFKLALENEEFLFGQYPDAYREQIAKTQFNLARLYIKLQDYNHSEMFHKLALENMEQLILKEPDVHRVGLAGVQHSLGLLYNELQNYTNCERYFKLALENRKQLFSQNPELYRGELAETQNYLGRLYLYLQDYANSETYLELALENRELLYKQNPDAYRTNLTDTQYNLSHLYAAQNNFVDAINMIDSAISIIPGNANFYDTKGEILLMQGKNEEAVAMWKKVLEINPDFLKVNPNGTYLSNGLKKLGLIE